MPTIDIDYADFEHLLGMKFNMDLDKVNEVLAFVKGEVKAFNEKDGVMSIEVKDTNRPDVWNIEGLVRALRGFLGLETGLKKYSIGKSVADVHVDHRLADIRPYIGCSIVKSIRLTDIVIKGLMHLQDKLDQTYGRNRRRASIGLYDFDLIVPPLDYTVGKPTKVSFVPLGFEEKMSLKEILKRHPKGLEYGSIVSRHPVYPLLLDSDGSVLSFPPVINSNNLGKITDKTRNVLVEVTGTSHETVLNTLRIVTLSLIDRGGKACQATVHYPREKVKESTPTFETSTMDLSLDYVNRVLGLRLTPRKVVGLLQQAGLGVVKLCGKNPLVEIPCYRLDVMHPIDVVEDIAIAYDYNNIEPLWRKLPTTSGEKPESEFLNVARELMVGLGFQEILTYTMTNAESLFSRMNCARQKVVEVANPKVQTMTCLRNWLLPSLMEFLSHNLSVEYPQRVFELGTVTQLNDKRETKTRDESWLAAVVCHSAAGFSEIKSALDAFLMNAGLEWQTKETKHASFIDGRVGAIVAKGTNVGVLGEIHPKVLEAWTLENPAAAFELNLERLIKIMKARQ